MDCFNPRARDGRDMSAVSRIVAQYPVSIHAPVMDAILTNSDFDFILSVSIHAPVMDAIRG